MQIYAFGSVCRGEVTLHSDVDLLAVVEGVDPRFDPEIYSIYSKGRLASLWQEGNPFAWHLALESVLIYTSNGQNYLGTLGEPDTYCGTYSDCRKFYSIYKDALYQLKHETTSEVFELSIVFLAIRNLATCYSLGETEKPSFSRDSALKLEKCPLSINPTAYDILSHARTLSTRGKGDKLEQEEIELAKSVLPEIETWMLSLMDKVQNNDRV